MAPYERFSFLIGVNSATICFRTRGAIYREAYDDTVCGKVWLLITVYRAPVAEIGVNNAFFF